MHFMPKSKYLGVVDSGSSCFIVVVVAGGGVTCDVVKSSMVG
jgi:hypothetical protein